MTKGTYIMKKIFAIAVITAITISTLCGCGKKNEVVETTTTTTVEEPSVVIEEPTTVEPTEESTEATPSEAETTVNLPSDEYLVDYPLTVGDQKVYFKYPTDIFTAVDSNESNIVLYIDDSKDYHQTNIGYSINNPWNIDYYKAHVDNGLFEDGTSTIVISEENCDNGITIYKADNIYEDNTITEYIIDYYIDDTNYVQILIKDNSTVDIETVLDFYRNAEDLFVVQ